LNSAVEKLSKEEVIHTTLLGLARRLGPGAKLPTVRQLCSKLSTSRSTMDRVLRVLETERILNCIQGSGIYVSQHSNQRKIGFIFPGNIGDPLRFSQFWGLIHAAALHVAERNGDELRTYFGCPVGGNGDMEPSAFSLSDDIEARRLNGLLVAGIRGDALAWLKSSGLPMVSLGSRKEVADASVDFDAIGCVGVGVQALRDAGCKRVAIVWFSGGDQLEQENDDTTLAFQKACGEARIPYHRDFRWTPDVIAPGRGWQSIEDAGAEIIRSKWAAKGEKPDGIFFADDTMAHGGLIALLEAGVKLGRDVKVASITHKGASLLRPFWSTLIRIELDPEETVEKMFSLLGKLLQSMKLADSAPNIAPTLVLPK